MIYYSKPTPYVGDNAIKGRLDEYREDVIVSALRGWVLIHLQRRKRLKLSLSMNDADGSESEALILS